MKNTPRTLGVNIMLNLLHVNHEFFLLFIKFINAIFI
jgi:hypothetical protein